MSEDRTAEILRYVSAMARDFGEHRQEMKEFRQEFNGLRQEFNQFRGETNARFESLEQQFQVFKREQRQLSQLVNRVVSAVLAVSTDVDELQDRLTLLEGKG